MTANTNTPVQTNGAAALAAAAASLAGTIVKPAADMGKITTKPRAPKAGKAGKADTGAAVVAGMVKGAKGDKAYMVVTGGTEAETQRTDARDFAPVTMAELSNTGSTLQSLAFNFLAGKVDKSITADTVSKIPRALRNEKSAIVKLLGQKPEAIRAAWEAEMLTRKRKDSPTLRALAALFKTASTKAPAMPWHAKIAQILDKKISADLKLQAIRELCEEAAPKN